MMKTPMSVWAFLSLIGLGLFLPGCGKVTGPISPLINPSIASFGSFDDGTTDSWVYDSSSPVNLSSTWPLTVTSQAFQGPYALEIPVPDLAYSVNAGVTTYISLSGYSVHYQITSSGQGLNLSNMTLSMWVKLVSGVVTAPNQIGAQIFLKDSAYQYANGTFVKLVPGQWMQVTYNVNAPNYQASPAPNVSNVYQVGLQLAGNGSSLFTSPGVVDADSFGWEKTP
jgi:hypothetical protein